MPFKRYIKNKVLSILLTLIRRSFPNDSIKYGHIKIWPVFSTPEKKKVQMESQSRAFDLLMEERFSHYFALIEKNIPYIVFSETLKHRLMAYPNNNCVIVSYVEETTTSHVFLASYLVGIATYIDIREKHSRDETLTIANQEQRDFLTQIDNTTVLLEWFDKRIQEGMTIFRWRDRAKCAEGAQRE